MIDILLVEAEKEVDRYNVISEGIRGSTRKTLINGICEFKNLKINRKSDAFTYRLMILPFVIDTDNPRNRSYYDLFVSEEIAIYTEGEIIQI
jgi:hypothetical protein